MTDPNFYAIIPATVRYDKGICPNAKLLYGEITALCSKEGYCWASNEYFAKLYCVANTTISEWIKQLNNSGHISIYTDGKNRKIYIHEKPKHQNMLREKPKYASGKAEGYASGKAEHSNTSIITTNITTTPLPPEGECVDDSFENFWKEYPKKVAKEVAKKSWRKIKHSEYDSLMASLDAHKASAQWKRDGGQYIPHPATWLNQRRWDGDAPPPEQEMQKGYRQSKDEFLLKAAEMRIS